MTTTAIIPEVVGLETTVLEESPMTEAEEKELVVVKTAINTAYADKLERDLAIGAGLLQIFRRKLYRGKDGGRTWPEWLKAESAELTAGRGPIEEKTSLYLRGFYQFRCEVLQPRSTCSSGSLPLPASPAQVRPLLGQLDTHPDAAVEMWKAAVADAKGKVPTFDQVNRAALAYKANEANEARRLSAAQQARQQKAVAANRAVSTSDSVKPRMFLNNEATWPTDMKREVYEARDYSPKPEPAAPSIPAWELERTDDSALDAVEECKKISRAINESHKAIGLLRGILYSQINKHGRDYLGFLRQVDAGVYSLHNIDSQIEQMGEDISFISELLTADVGEGELAASTINVESFPTRS
jgi:ribosomal protein S6